MSACEPAPAFGVRPTRHALRGSASVLRHVQQEAYDAWLLNDQRGIVVLPCGVGKTIMIIKALVSSNAFSALIVTANSQNAYQLKHDILRHTDFAESSICILTGSEKQSISNKIEVIAITTYCLFGRNTCKMNMTTRHYRDQITAHKWDFLALDEVHVAPAPLFRDFVDRVFNRHDS